MRQQSAVLPAAAIASVIVAVVSIVAYLVSPNGSGADSLAQAINSLPRVRSVTLLAQEEHQIVVMNAATSAMVVAASPARVTPAEIQAAGGGSSSGAASGTLQETAVLTGEATPAEAQAIAQQLMPSFGFSVSSQWSCLLDLWTKESSWEWDAANPTSTAYGIPQANPGSRMASVASDWQTDATTQIRWGLDYISQVYGTPCVADAHELADHNY